MIQVSLLGFAVGGAFLSLLYFDVPYYLMVAMVATRTVVAQELAAQSKKQVDAKQLNRDSRVPNPVADARIGGSMLLNKPLEEPRHRIP